MRQAGFTLIELLVAMTLLALVAVGLSSGIQFGTRVWQRAESGRAEWEARQATRQLLQRSLQRLVPQSLSQEPSDGTIAFLGAPARLRFITPAPARSAPPGLYRVELALAESDEGQELLFRWQVFAGEPLRAPLAGAESRVLLQGLEGASLAYFGRRDEGWLRAWSDRVDLPQLVALRFASDSGRAPEAMLFETHLGVPEP